MQGLDQTKGELAAGDGAVTQTETTAQSMFSCWLVGFLEGRGLTDTVTLDAALSQLNRADFSYIGRRADICKAQAGKSPASPKKAATSQCSAMTQKGERCRNTRNIIHNGMCIFHSRVAKRRELRALERDEDRRLPALRAEAA